MSEEPLPPEILLDDYPPDIQAVANALRAVVMTAVPDAIERVRIGWRLIGYDVPAGRRTRYFAFVVPDSAALDHLRLRLLLRIRECWIVGDRVDPRDESVGGVPRTGYALELLNEIHAPSPELGSALARNPGMPDE